MRTCHLTSPEMRGTDIRDLQKVLNERLEHYKSRTRIKTNGIYDRETAHAVAVVARAEGLSHYDGIPAVTRLIEHPHLRNPHELMLEHERKKLAEHHDTIAAGAQGLARIPIIAAHYVGVHENPANSNWGEPDPAGWEKNFGFESGVPWCACFSCSMVNLAGGAIHGGNPAFCPNLEAYARSRTNGFDLWVADHQSAGVGWLALFNWSGGSEPEHVEIVKEIHSDHLVCVGGNTGSEKWGGEVAIEQRPYNFVVGYCRPRI
jgi:hypothetical protein